MDNRLKDIRDLTRKSKAELAQLLNISEELYNDYESGVKEIPIEIKQRVMLWKSWNR